MRRIIALLFLLTTLPFICFAEVETTFEQKSQCLYVNLAADYFMKHSTNCTWSSGTATSSSSSDYYYDNQILCILGVLAEEYEGGTSSAVLPEEDIVITAELLSGYWSYVLDGTDIRYMRPFGIQMIGRGKDATLFAQGGHGNLGSDYNFYLGSDTKSSTTVTLPAETAVNYSAVWWDMVLVFDYNVDTDTDTVLGADGTTTYNLVSSDSYYTAQIRISITCGSVTDTYDVYLNGYYKSSNTYSGDTSTISSTMNLTRLVTANAVDIETLFNANASTTTDIATYNYATNTVSGTNTGCVYFFLSSASSGLNSSAEEFLLRHVGSDGVTSYRDTNHNSVKYYAYLKSDTGHSSTEDSSVSGTTVKFDGTGYFSSGISCDYIVVEAYNYVNQDGAAYTRWSDTGTITVGIPSSQTVNGNKVTVSGLVAGQYTSNIYLHIVTNF